MRRITRIHSWKRDNESSQCVKDGEKAARRCASPELKMKNNLEGVRVNAEDGREVDVFDPDVAWADAPFGSGGVGIFHGEFLLSENT